MQRPPLTRDEIAHLDHEATVQERLVLRLLYETGCTVSELCGLKKDYLREGLLHVGEAGQERRVKLAGLTRQLLLAALHQDSAHTGQSHFLFATRESKRISPRRVEQLLAALGERVLGTRVTPRQLRATRICHDIDAGLPLADIERKVGLKNLGPHLYRHAQRWRT